MKARSRIIHPGFFTNLKLAELPPLTRLLFAGLWTIADKLGRVEDEPKRIKLFTLPYDDDADVGQMLEDLQNGGFLIRYPTDEGNFIQICNWDKYQSPHWNEAESIIPQGDTLKDSSKSLASPLQVSKRVSKSKSKRENPEIPFEEIISHLNLLTDQNYKWGSSFNQQWIRARWREGSRLGDFIYVNEVKAEEWLGTDKEKYLRPQTLYGTKMESYRQQRRIPRQYSEKTNKALLAAAKYLKQEGFEIDQTGPAQIDSGNAKAAISVPKRD